MQVSLPLHSVSCSQSCVHGGRDFSLVEGIHIAEFLHEDLPTSPYIGDYKSIQNKEGKKGRQIKGSEGRSFRMPHKDQIRAEKFKMSGLFVPYVRQVSNSPGYNTSARIQSHRDFAICYCHFLMQPRIPLNSRSATSTSPALGL